MFVSANKQARAAVQFTDALTPGKHEMLISRHREFQASSFQPADFAETGRCFADASLDRGWAFSARGRDTVPERRFPRAATGALFICSSSPMLASLPASTVTRKRLKRLGILARRSVTDDRHRERITPRKRDDASACAFLMTLLG